MNTFWFRLILRMALLLTSSWGVAGASFKNNFDYPYIMSGLWDPIFKNGQEVDTQCRIITVNAFTEVDGKVFFQQGVGWVLLGNNGYKILTPSHVVAGAQVITGLCRGHEFLLNLQSRTETKDLALLSLADAANSWARPLIYLKDRREVIKQMDAPSKDGAEHFYPDHFAVPLAQKIRQQFYNFYLIPTGDGVMDFMTNEADLAVHGISHFKDSLNSLVAETLAIRPGFSGAPLFAQVPAPREKLQENKNFFIYMMMPETYYQPYLLGMLTKAEINGSRSFGISLPEILDVLPALWSSQDPSRDAYVDQKKSSLRLKYRLTYDGKDLIRTQELLTPDKIYTEICNDSSVESSEWDKNPSKNKNLLKMIQSLKKENKYKLQTPQIDIKKKYETEIPKSNQINSIKGKSGGGDYGEGGGGLALKNAVLMSPERGVLHPGESLTSYKQIHSCNMASIRDQKNISTDSLNVNGQWHKATNLSELFDLLASPSSDLETCKNYYIREYSPDYTPYKDSVYIRTEGDANSASQGAQGTYTCDPSTQDRSVQFANKHFKFDLLFSAFSPKAQGRISVGKTCTVQLNAKNYKRVNRWKHQIRSPQIDVDITLGTQGRLLSMKVLKVNPECSKFEGPLWMYEMNFLDSIEGKRIFTRGVRGLLTQGKLQ